MIEVQRGVVVGVAGGVLERGLGVVRGVREGVSSLPRPPGREGLIVVVMLGGVGKCLREGGLRVAVVAMNAGGLARGVSVMNVGTWARLAGAMRDGTR